MVDHRAEPKLKPKPRRIPWEPQRDARTTVSKWLGWIMLGTAWVILFLVILAAGVLALGADLRVLISDIRAGDWNALGRDLSAIGVFTANVLIDAARNVIEFLARYVGGEKIEGPTSPIPGREFK